MLRRQELLDRIRQEQLNEDKRPRTYTPRRRYTPSPLPPPSRRSLPEVNRREYYFNQVPQTTRDMAQVKHVIEHQFRQAPQAQQQPAAYTLPPIQQGQLTTVQPVSPVPVAQIQPAYAYVDAGRNTSRKDTMFNKAGLARRQPRGRLALRGPDKGPVDYMSDPGDYEARQVQQYKPAFGELKRYSTPPALKVVRTDVRRVKPYPFPGPRLMRKLRHIAYASWFVAILNRAAKKNKATRPSSVFLFGIILKEMVAALHRIYLNPNGNMYPVILDIIGPGTQDLSQLLFRQPGQSQSRFRGRQNRDREREELNDKLGQILQYVVENLIYHMTEIMPKTGVLGTHKKAAVFELIKTSKRFPDGYFWQIELDRLEFDGNGRTVNVGNFEAFVLLVGVFLSRSMITTLLMRPVDYGLSNEQLSDAAERNLKILATCLLFIVRRVSVKRDSPMLPMPGEVARYVYADEEMRPIHLRMRRSYEYCENLLREWGAEYIKRLRHAATTIQPPNVTTTTS